MLIILSGKAGSGKDTVADYLTGKNFIKCSLASPVKDIVSIITGWDRELIEGRTEESRKFREEVKSQYGKTARELMQFIGTDLFRAQLSEDVWVNILIDKILKDSKKDYVISDVRFNNEIEKIISLKLNVIPIYIVRDTRDEKSHISENALNVEFFRYNILNNNGSLSDLFSAVDDIIKKN